MTIEFNSGGGGGGGRERPRKREVRTSPLWSGGGVNGRLFPADTVTYPGQFTIGTVPLMNRMYNHTDLPHVYTYFTGTSGNISLSIQWPDSVWKDMVVVRAAKYNDYQTPPEIDLYIDGDEIGQRPRTYTYTDNKMDAVVDKYGYGGSISISFSVGTNGGGVNIMHAVPYTLVGLDGYVIYPDAYYGQSVSRY